MKKILSIVSSLIIGASAYNIDIQPGWQLKGALSDINVTSFNNMNIASVWAYDSVNNKWKAYLPNLPISLAAYDIEDLKQIKQGEGFWVNAIGFTNIEINETSNESASASSANAYDNNLSAKLIDKPTDFNLSDVAGKTFKLFNYDNGNFDDLVFDSNGTATWEKKGVTYTFKFENGLIDVYENDLIDEKLQKIAGDDNGFIQLATVYNYDGNNTLESSYQYLLSLLTTVNPVDMSTLSYPKTYYNSYGKIFTFNEDGTFIYADGSSESNYSIEDGKIITSNQWGDENNGESAKDDYQIVGTVGRYSVMEEHEVYSKWHLEDALKGKTFNDVIDTNTSVNGYQLKSDGTIVSDYYEDVNISYEKISDTEIKIQKCYSDGECWNDGVIAIDPDTGKVSEIYDSYWTDVVSESPIVNETNSTVSYKKSSKSLDFKLKREEIQKRIF